MPMQLITPPAGEPVSLQEAKAHLRVDFDDDDGLIQALIAAARQAAETITNRQLMSARWKLVMDSFPGPSLMGVPAGQPFSLPGHAILIHKSPVLNVVSINYLDMAGVLQSMPASNYTVDAACEPARMNRPGSTRHFRAVETGVFRTLPERRRPMCCGDALGCRTSRCN